MQHPPQIRLGSAKITFDRRRFIFKDLYHPQAVVTVEEVDVPDLILFLHQWSQRAAAKVRLELLPEAKEATGPTH